MKAERSLNPEDWLTEHGDVLYGYALSRVRSPEIAEDLLQETFIAALKGREAYQGKSAERTWLVGILRHKILDYYRRKDRETPLSNLEREESDSALDDLFDRLQHWKNPPRRWPDPREAVQQQEFWQVLATCVEALPGRWAEAFTLRTLEQLTTEETRKIMDVSTTHLGALLHRARVRLRECLEKNWFTGEKR